MSENKRIDPKDVLAKALRILDDALKGRIVNPSALNTAISMTQYMWMSVYSETERLSQTTEAARMNFDDDEIREKQSNDREE